MSGSASMTSISDCGKTCRAVAATGASSAEAAVEKPAIRRCPSRPLETCSTSARICSQEVISPSVRCSSTRAAGVRRTLRPAGSSSRTPRSRASVRSWWETAEGV